MSRERFQSETGQTIDDNCCSLFFGNSSPLFYTVNPRSGISLRHQEQLGAPSILKSFRDLPGCTRLSSSLTNLDSSSKRAQFPLLPDISQKGNMGKSLQGHHSSSKRFVRERYNPPFKVNAKIRHVYTQEVTTIEQGQDHHQNHHAHSRHGSHHHHHSSSRNRDSSHDVVTCHRQTQTEPPAQFFPSGEESKRKPEVEEEHAKSQENKNDGDDDSKIDQNEPSVEGDVIMEQRKVLSRTNSKSQQIQNGDEMKETETGHGRHSSNNKNKKTDASTSPIPSPYFTNDSLEPTNINTNPFSGCSQMTVYPPLNYVRKLEDLEKITGHIVIQRFFTKTDDAFGTWLERQLGMTSKSVSVDTSEFENAKTAELQEEGEKTGIENGDGGSASGTEMNAEKTVVEATEQTLTENNPMNYDIVENKQDEGMVDEEKADEKTVIVSEKVNEEKSNAEIADEVKTNEEKANEETVIEEKANEETVIEEKANEETVIGEKSNEEKADEVKANEETADEVKANEETAVEEKVNEETKVEELVPQVGFITGAISNPGEGDLQETENQQPTEENPTAAAVDCGFTDPVKCECYLEEISRANEYEEVKQLEDQIVPLQNDNEMADTEAGITVADEVETLVSSSTDPILCTVQEEENNKIATEKANLNKNEDDIDEVVRCTLEAYLLAPLEFEDINENEEVEKQNKKNELESRASPVSATTIKSEVDSGRADSIQSQENNKSFDGLLDSTEGNTTSHDSVETVYEIPIAPPKHIDLENGPTRILQRCLSADSCIGTESSGDAKNQTTNASQSSNDTIEVLDPIIIAPKELVELNLGSPASAPPTSARSQTTKLPAIPSAKSVKLVKIQRCLSSAQSQRSMSPGGTGITGGVISTGRGHGLRRSDKTDVEAEDADGESETESEITDNQFILSGRPSKHHHHPDGTDLELEEVEEDEGDDDDRDAFDKMVANHLKYSRGLPTATANRRSRLNRGTQTTKSIEPSTTSGSVSPCSSSNSSFDVEIISKSKRITTASSGGGGLESERHHDMITPSNMTLAWHESGRRRSYLPSSSSSLNLLNMKFSLGKDFESEVSIRMPTTNKSSMLSGNSANIGSASMLLPGSGGTSGKTPLISSSSRTHHHHHYPSYHNRGLSSSSHHSAGHQNHDQTLQSPLTSATTTTMQIVSEPAMGAAAPTTELQSLWKDVRTKLDVQVNEIASTVIEEEEDNEGLHVRGSGILPSDPTPSSGSVVVRMRRNEEKIKRSLQRLKKILDD